MIRAIIFVFVSFASAGGAVAEKANPLRDKTYACITEKGWITFPVAPKEGTPLARMDWEQIERFTLTVSDCDPYVLDECSATIKWSDATGDGLVARFAHKEMRAFSSVAGQFNLSNENRLFWVMLDFMNSDDGTSNSDHALLFQLVADCFELD